MFVSFEGTEGVGKSTLVQALKQKLEAHGRQVTLTREPGGAPVSEQIRELLLNANMHAQTELLLMFAARREHLECTVLPALARGDVVLCDRFVDASVAYQGFGRGLALEQIQVLQDHFVTAMPELTFWLDMEVNEGIARARARAELDRFEREASAFFERVRAGYQCIAEKNPQRVVRLDASLGASEVAECAWEHLIKKLAEGSKTQSQKPDADWASDRSSQ